MARWYFIKVTAATGENKGYLAELVGPCGTPCEIGKGWNPGAAVDDLARQLRGRLQARDCEVKMLVE